MDSNLRPGQVIYFDSERPPVARTPSDITRLWWDGDHGLVRHDGVTVDLATLPRIDGLPLHLRAIDFAPAMRVTMVRESAQAWREMSPQEREAIAQFLIRLVGAVRGVVA